MKYIQALTISEQGSIEIFKDGSNFKAKEMAFGKHGESVWNAPSKSTKAIATAVSKYLKAKHPEWLEELKSYNIDFPDYNLKSAGNTDEESNVIITSEDGKRTFIITAKQYMPYLIKS